MWVPPTWLIGSLAAGAAQAGRPHTAVTTGETRKVVRCEACGRRYAYLLARTGVGAADRSSEGAHRVAAQRAQEDLQRKLATGVEAVPCPACGWYQSDMIPEARKRHRLWMSDVGLCLTVGLLPLAGVGLLVADRIPEAWSLAPAFLAGLACLFVVGIGMLIARHQLAITCDPNEEDVEARTRYGQSLATLMSEEEAQGDAS